MRVRTNRTVYFEGYSNMLGGSPSSVKSFQAWANSTKGLSLKVDGNNGRQTKNAYIKYGNEYDAQLNGVIPAQTASPVSVTAISPQIVDKSAIGAQSAIDAKAAQDADIAAKAKADADAAAAKAAANPSDPAAQKAAADAKAKADADAQTAQDSANKAGKGMSKNLKIGLIAGGSLLVIVIIIMALKK